MKITCNKHESHQYFHWQQGSEITKEFYKEWKGNHKIIIAVGAIRSGKTVVSLATFLKFIVNSSHNTFAMAGRGINTLERNVVKPFLLMLNNYHVKYTYSKYNQLIELPDLHKVIHLFGMDNEQSESRIRGFTAGGTLIDEVTVLPKSAVQMLISRNSLSGSKIFMTCNPTNPNNFVYEEYVNNQELINDGEVKVYNFYLQDNLTLSEDARHMLESIYPKDSVFYKRNILNQWVTGHGMIFDMFTDDNILKGEIDRSKYHRFGVGSDYGTTNMTCYSLIGITQLEEDNSREYHVLAEKYFDASREGYQQTDTQRVSDVLQMQEKYNLDNRVSFYVSHDANNFKAALEQERKIKLDVKSFKPNTLDCISKLSQLMGDNKLKIHESCKETIKQIQGYEWDSKKAGKGIDAPIKENDHLIDSMRAPIMEDMQDDDIVLGVVYL